MPTAGSAGWASSPCTSSAALHALHEVLLDLLALGDRDDRLLPVGLVADPAAEATRLALHRHGVHRDDVHLERLRNGGGDLVLGRVGRDRERVAALVGLAHRALGDDRTEDYERAFHADTVL